MKLMLSAHYGDEVRWLVEVDSIVGSFLSRMMRNLRLIHLKIIKMYAAGLYEKEILGDCSFSEKAQSCSLEGCCQWQGIQAYGALCKRMGGKYATKEETRLSCSLSDDSNERKGLTRPSSTQHVTLNSKSKVI